MALRILHTFSHLHAAGLVAVAAFFAACGGANGDKTSTSTSAFGDDCQEGGGGGGTLIPSGQQFCNDNGESATITSDGSSIDTSHNNPFFDERLGTNGRACGTCHRPEDGWTFAAATAQRLFDETDGTDPLFRALDGANSPTADVSTVDARRAAYSLLLTKGLIRIQLNVPATADFEVIAVDDPYGYATTTTLSLYRRPLPATNLKFVNPIMWDGRERLDLSSQAQHAATAHAQAGTLAPATLAAIVAFEETLTSAQTNAAGVGTLTAKGANGGPGFLQGLPFAFMQNQPFYANEFTSNCLFAPNGHAFVCGQHTDTVFNLFDSWATENKHRQQVKRGQDIFNNRVLAQTNSDVFNISPRVFFNVKCASCHDGLNTGGDTLPTNIVPDIAMMRTVQVSSGELRTPDLPLYTVRSKVTGQIKLTTDPGSAMISGKFSKLDRFKAPTLRNLSAHPPYFHNGRSATLADVVKHYSDVFSNPNTTDAPDFVGGAPLTDQEQADLTAFLGTL